MQVDEQEAEPPDAAPGPIDTPEAAQNVPALIRDLVIRIEHLESQNAELQKKLEQRPPPSAHSKTYRRSALHPAREPPHPVQRPGARTSMRRPAARKEPGTINLETYSKQAEELGNLFAPDASVTVIRKSRKSGRVRSRFRRQFRFFSMARLHGILAGFCLATGSIVGAVAFALGYSVIYYAGLVISALGLIYLLVVGVFWIGMRLALDDEGKVVEMDSTLPNRPAQSLFSTVIYWIGRLLHIAGR